MVITIRLSDPRPILLRQTRAGYRLQPFEIIKTAGKSWTCDNSPDNFERGTGTDITLTILDDGMDSGDIVTQQTI